MRLDPVVRRQQILDAAISYFAEAGFGVQTRELSRRLGVSQPLLYRYFPSKQDLISAVFEAVFMSQWRNEWMVELQDRKLPLRERLRVGAHRLHQLRMRCIELGRHFKAPAL